MRPFELANEACKPKHFGPPTRLQRRLRDEQAYGTATPERDERAEPAGWLRRAIGFVLRQYALHVRSNTAR
jgi:hypothetical protein